MKAKDYFENFCLRYDRAIKLIPDKSIPFVELIGNTINRMINEIKDIAQQRKIRDLMTVAKEQRLKFLAFEKMVEKKYGKVIEKPLIDVFDAALELYSGGTYSKAKALDDDMRNIRMDIRFKI